MKFATFYILREDGCYYAGTVDRNSIWTKRKKGAAAFVTRELAEKRINGLVEGGYEVVT